MESTPPSNAPQPPIPPPVPASSPRPQGWWQRNWKWFVPTGCLTIFFLFAVFVGCIVMIVFGALKSTDVYKTALERAKADSRVREVLGRHIHDGMFPGGKTNVNGASGEAELAISISGSKGKGTLYVEATKSAGQWQYSKLAVKTGDETIDLLQSDDEDIDDESIDEDDDDDTI